MQSHPNPADAARKGQAPSLAARARRERRSLLALCGMVLVALAVVAASSSPEDSGLTDAGARTSPQFDREPGVRDEPLSPRAEFKRAPASVAATSNAPDSDDALPAVSTRQRAPRKQAEYAAGLRAISDHASLLAAIDAALGSDRPAAESFAALEVAYERLGEQSDAHFLRAARDLTQSSADAESVGRSSVTWLGRRALQEPTARHVLSELARCYELAPTLRAAAGVALVQNAPASDLAGIENRLLRDRDTHVVLSVESALASRRASPSSAIVVLEPRTQE